LGDTATHAPAIRGKFGVQLVGSQVTNYKGEIKNLVERGIRDNVPESGNGTRHDFGGAGARAEEKRALLHQQKSAPGGRLNGGAGDWWRTKKPAPTTTASSYLKGQRAKKGKENKNGTQSALPTRVQEKEKDGKVAAADGRRRGGGGPGEKDRKGARGPIRISNSREEEGIKTTAEAGAAGRKPQGC